MPPQPILLYRRRWTLVFQVPFVLLMAICLAFSLYWASVSNDRLLTALCLCAAFVSFCVGGTLGRSALEAYREQDPAIVIDATGITDLRQDDPHTVPWEAMERVHLDDYEGVILVKLRPGHKDSALGVIIKTLKRWQQRGDVVFALGGLAHDPRQIQTALKAFHAAAATKPRTRLS